MSQKIHLFGIKLSNFVQRKWSDCDNLKIIIVFQGGEANMDQFTITLAIASIMVLGYYIGCAIAGKSQS